MHTHICTDCRCIDHMHTERYGEGSQRQPLSNTDKVRLRPCATEHDLSTVCRTCDGRPGGAPRVMEHSGRSVEPCGVLCEGVEHGRGRCGGGQAGRLRRCQSRRGGVSAGLMAALMAGLMLGVMLGVMVALMAGLMLGVMVGVMAGHRGSCILGLHPSSLFPASGNCFQWRAMRLWTGWLEQVAGWLWPQRCTRLHARAMSTLMDGMRRQTVRQRAAAAWPEVHRATEAVRVDRRSCRRRARLRKKSRTVSVAETSLFGGVDGRLSLATGSPAR